MRRARAVRLAEKGRERGAPLKPGHAARLVRVVEAGGALPAGRAFRGKPGRQARLYAGGGRR